MKKLLLLSVAVLLCWGCSKDALQSDELNMAGQDAAAARFMVGVGFWGMEDNVRGSATVNGSPGLILKEPTKVTVEAHPNPGFALQYWMIYNEEPSESTSEPRPPYTTGHVGQDSFTEVVSKETWYEPVFEEVLNYTNVMISDMIDYSTVYSDSYIDYTNRYGEQVTFSIRDIYDHYTDGNYLTVQKGSDITFHMRVWLKTGSDKVYCAIRMEPDGSWKNFSDYGLATGELTISNVQNQGMQFGIWASGEDFSGGQLDSSSGGL